jgi:hypothetical protein
VAIGGHDGGRCRPSIEDNSLVATAARDLLDTLSVLRSLVSTARCELDPDNQLLRDAELKAIMMTVDLQRLERGLPPLGIVTTRPVLRSARE